jgi:hypothetical protein
MSLDVNKSNVVAFYDLMFNNAAGAQEIDRNLQ